ncbi:MAG: DegQ family serine endoprotease [bacterium]|nr:DegQ family serine endoprotease [bacterium]MDD5353733.1 DegQ family serine endoprotease [bacterium]MDD5755895.1 DegQ family serine endoprotease [bacterium]
MDRKIKFITMAVLVILLLGAGAFFGRSINSLWCTSTQALNLGPTIKPEITVPQAVMNLQDAFVTIAEQLKPTVVNISTTQVIKQEYQPYEFFFGNPFDNFFDDFFNGQQPNQQRPKQQKKYLERKLSGTGSGVIISADGYILTNNHVIGGASEIEVTLSDERKFKGKIIGQDPKTDLAIIKIPADKLPAAMLGDSDKIRVGDWSIAIGSPFGLEQTVTVGIISARRQSLTIDNQQLREMIQTDAAINQGNSGGPLINIKGEVIGINTAIYTPTGGFVGVGFATPINKAKAILVQLIEKGKVTRGWLGVEIRPVDEAVAKQFGLKEARGVLLNSVMKDAPAERAGLKRGDIIIEYDGKPVKDTMGLQDLVAQTEPKKKTKVKIWRNNKEEMFDLVVGEMPGEVKEGEKNIIPGQAGAGGTSQVSKEWLGMKVQPLTKDMANQLGYESAEKGVIIAELAPGSKAESAGLQVKDVIRSINRQAVTTIKEFEKITAAAKLSDGIVFDINRRGRLIYLTIQEK